jgi:hypothetical protein
VQLLRDAALRADYDGVRAAIDAVRALSTEADDGAVFEHLSSAGLILLSDGQAGLAVDIFGLMTERFPEHPDGYLWLEQACRRSGQTAAAEEAHQHALDIDPAIVAIATQ